MKNISRESLVRDHFLESVQGRIAEYERRTSVEFVPVLVHASGDYGVYRSRAALLAILLSGIAFAFFHHPFLWVNEALISMLVGGLVWWISGIDLFERLLVPQRIQKSSVEEGAALHFLSEEVFATRRRTGVLIYISLFEQAVFLIADKGLTTKVPDEEWQRLGLRLAQDFSRGSAGAVFLDALNEIMTRIEADFPPDPDNPNELPDGIRSERLPKN